MTRYVNFNSTLSVNVHDARATHSPQRSMIRLHFAPMIGGLHCDGQISQAAISTRCCDYEKCERVSGLLLLVRRQDDQGA